MSLTVYRKKRDFTKTKEPKGKSVSKKTQKKNLYIIQKHAASHLHYDFRLELNDVLLSWAVPKGPSLDPAVKRLAMHVEDHPIEYGSFEGIIPKGQYGGGTVMLWDEGDWIPEEENPTEAYRRGSLTFTLHGKKLKGRWKLIRMHNDDKTWLLMKIKDEYAKPSNQYDITVEKPNSVVSKKSIEQIAGSDANIWDSNKGGKKNVKKKSLKPLEIDLPIKPTAFPKEIWPELATLTDAPPAGDEWLHEIKLDGYRLLAFKKDGKTKLFTRNQNNWTNKFPSIVAAIDALPEKNILLDGEIVVLDDNQHSNFQLLQNSIKANDSSEFIFYVFDLLYLDKYNLSSLALIERKEILQKIIPEEDTILKYSDHIIGSGKKIFTNACKMGLEGIVSKKIDAVYIQGRTKDWLKVKCTKRQEFVIAGFTKPKNSRKFFGSLLLGFFNKQHQLIYCGNVGTGFSETSLQEIHKKLSPLKTAEMPFTKRPPGSNQATWVQPELVAEIEFTEWTKDGSLRHPSFKGLRQDKPAQSIIKEEAMPIETIEKKTPASKKKNTVKLTNPTKILYPEDDITKQDIAEYYQEISDWILPYIVQRPLTLVRCPQGYKHKCFFQKHINADTPDGLFPIMIKEKSGEDEYLYLKNQTGLDSLIQLGTLEIHTWNSKVSKVEYPDMLIFDLDPAEDVEWKKVVKAAFEIKNYLKEYKLKCFVKTTGGKGLHVVVPIKPEYDWEAVKNFAHVFVDFIVMRHPGEYVSKMTKSKRVGKIYIDYLRNQRGATAIAPYSTRARIHAPVATPIDWDELSNNFLDTFFTIETVPSRLAKLKKDPWADFFKTKQSLRLGKLKK